jgi:fatty-acyl-CoA synthase
MLPGDTPRGSTPHRSICNSVSVTVSPDACGLAHHARAFPDKPAVIVGETTRTYAELNARVNRLARALAARRRRQGDAVGAALHNGFEWYELLNAVGKLGAQLVPIGYRARGPEIAYLLADSGARVLISG